MKRLSKCPHSKKPTPPRKIPGCALEYLVVPVVPHCIPYYLVVPPVVLVVSIVCLIITKDVKLPNILVITDLHKHEKIQKKDFDF